MNRRPCMDSPAQANSSTCACGHAALKSAASHFAARGAGSGFSPSRCHGTSTSGRSKLPCRCPAMPLTSYKLAAVAREAKLLAQGSRLEPHTDGDQSSSTSSLGCRLAEIDWDHSSSTSALRSRRLEADMDSTVELVASSAAALDDAASAAVSSSASAQGMTSSSPLLLDEEVSAIMSWRRWKSRPRPKGSERVRRTLIFASAQKFRDLDLVNSPRPAWSRIWSRTVS
mmetsp:Transcript_14487/g.41865  ORF Transcript_14487/g.41865 Transcript_14487/m.41865 type:complete len:228 (-) Transcript_14487:455-1138(-)